MENWHSQHSLLLVKYIVTSDSPPSLTYLINTFYGGLESKPQWRNNLLIRR